MRSVKLSLRKYQLITKGIPRKQHNRRFTHRYLVAQQHYYRDDKNTWEACGTPTLDNYLDKADDKDELKSVLDK